MTDPVSLLVQTREIDDPGDLMGLLPADAPVAWVRGHDGIVGWGSIAESSPSGSARFATAEQWWDDLTSRAIVRDTVGLPGTGLIAFGSFPFSGDSDTGRLVVPEVVVGRRDGTAWVTTIGVRADLSPALAQHDPIPLPPTTLIDEESARSTWKAAVAEAVAHIRDGELDKVVLARAVDAQFAQPLDVRTVLRSLADGYPTCWTFHLDGFFGATPELLVRLERGLVTSRVLAGTIRRTGDDSRDLALAGSLARSSKDLEEHEYAVRSVANALASHCTSMNVPESPFVLHLPNVMHLATDVTGVLRDGASAISLAAALHPSAAVGGTPTEAAVAMIGQIEGLDRGRYAGPVGWVSASGDGEWGIGLRSAQLSSDRRSARVFAGCGIVADSDPEAELAEADAKLQPVLTALAH